MIMECEDFTPHKKESNSDYCIVRGCESSAKKNPTISFHRFPKQNVRFVNIQNAFGDFETLDRYKAWTIILKVQNVTKRAKVCCLHFEKTDYLFPDIKASRRFLKKNAVPSRNLPNDSNSKRMKEAVDKARLERRQKRSNQNLIKRSDESLKANVKQEICENDGIQTSVNIEKNCEESKLLDSVYTEKMYVTYGIQCNNFKSEENEDYKENTEIDITSEFFQDTFVKPGSSEPLVKDVEVQVNTDCFVPSIIRTLTSNSTLNTVAGLKSFGLLDAIVEIVKEVTDNKFEHYSIKMNTRDGVIMTYTKLKQNISYSFLAILFQCYSAKHCQRIFHETIIILNKCFSDPLLLKEKKQIIKEELVLASKIAKISAEIKKSNQ